AGRGAGLPHRPVLDLRTGGRGDLRRDRPRARRPSRGRGSDGRVQRRERGGRGRVLHRRPRLPRHHRADPGRARAPRATARRARRRGRGPAGRRGVGAQRGAGAAHRAGALTVLLFGLGIAVVGLGLALSIALHELGHLVPAKLFGVRVTQYMIGFGPTLLSRTRGETEYGLKAIPLGGYIRMIGMYPPHKGEPEGTIREDSTGLLQQITELSDEAKAYESAQYGPEDAHRTFVALSVPKKLVVMLGGPAMNLLISVVLMLVLVSGIGLPAITPTVQSVSECVVPADAPADVSCEGRPPAPALAAGIRPGDTLREIDGHRIQRWQDVTTAVREAGDRTVDVVVERDGEELELQATMVVDDRPVLDEDGAAVHDAAGDLVTEQVGFLGVAGTPDLEPQSPVAVPEMAWTA